MFVVQHVVLYGPEEPEDSILGHICQLGRRRPTVRFSLPPDSYRVFQNVFLPRIKRYRFGREDNV